MGQRHRPRWRRIALPALAALAAALVLSAPASAAPQLRVGVSRADITPPTGYYMMGWVRSDAKAAGQHTRLWARVIVLERGGQRWRSSPRTWAAIPGGMMADGGRAGRRSSASRAKHPRLRVPHPLRAHRLLQLLHLQHGLHDHQLADRVRAHRRPRPAALLLHGPPPGAGDPPRRRQPRAGEARLGQDPDPQPDREPLARGPPSKPRHPRGFGEGSVSQDPQGRLHTLDPDVNVLRVDKTIGGRQVPMGMWSTFANHGTVVRFQFTYYNRDHHGAATQLVEAAIRRAGRAPAGQDVVNVYGNTDEGDQTAGLHRAGPAAADHVGRVEASAFMRAWREAGKAHERDADPGPPLDPDVLVRPQTAAGPVAERAVFGLPQFTGSEEGRGPLFDVTGVPFEGHDMPGGRPAGEEDPDPAPGRRPRRGPAHGPADRPADDRLDTRRDDRRDGAPGAPRGRRRRPRLRHHRAVISGLANEYVDYFTTPQEYDAQHYEGGATVYGRASSVASRRAWSSSPGAWSRVARRRCPIRMTPVTGSATPPCRSRSAPLARASPISPPRWRRLWHPNFAWRGGVRGFDRPLDRPSSRSSAAP